MCQIMKKTLSLSVCIFYPKHSSYEEDIILVSLYHLPKTFKLWRRHYPCLFVSFTQNIQVMKKTLSLSVCIFYPKHSSYEEDIILVCLYLLPKTFKLWRRYYPCLFVSFTQNIQVMKKILSLFVCIFYPKHSSYEEDIILVCLYLLSKTFKLWRRHYPCLFVSFTQNIQVMKKTLSLSVYIFYPKHSSYEENIILVCLYLLPA